MEFDKAELTLYEAVEKMPPFSRKTLVLVSPPGLGKQQIIRRLVESNPDMFGTTMPSKLQKIQTISALMKYFIVVDKYAFLSIQNTLNYFSDKPTNG